MSLWYEKEPQYTENKNCPVCGRNLSEVTAHQLVGVGELMKIYTCSGEHSKEFIRQIWKLSKRNDNANVQAHSKPLEKSAKNLNTIKIGNQEWMAENLNLTDEGLGKDHWKDEKTGEVYYTWKAAKRLAKKVKGYHIPDNKEWNESCNVLNVKEKLKITLAGFHGVDFYQVDLLGLYWSSSEFACRNAWYLKFSNFVSSYIPRYVQYKDFGYSVRLVKDSV